VSPDPKEDKDLPDQSAVEDQRVCLQIFLGLRASPVLRGIGAFRESLGEMGLFRFGKLKSDSQN